MKDLVSPIQKFVVAAVGLIVAIGVLDPGVAQTIVSIVTAVAVYLVPNK
jgi:hypothetical protein